MSKIKVNPANKISKSSLTKADVKAIIVEEGIGAAIRDYLDVKKIEDATLAGLVKAAKLAIRKVQDYVYG